MIEVRQDNKLNFPAVTICNLNPLRMHMMQAYVRVWDQQMPKTAEGVMPTTVHTLMQIKDSIGEVKTRVYRSFPRISSIWYKFGYGTNM